VTRIDTARTLEEAVQELLTMRSIIVDMRGYPHIDAFEIAEFLADSDVSFVSAQNQIPFVSKWPRTQFLEMPHELYPTKSMHFPGKIYVLINEDAVSHSEAVCMALERASRRVTFVGTPTAGANGNVTQMVLPGGYHVSFTGLGSRHADGRQLQRVGILPDVRVAPSIAGLRARRDEPLELAIKLAQRSGKR
jgi:C-terminal processing protease CtpA/Prc